jgi:tetratricopeptide (TPR) repeat protein
LREVLKDAERLGDRDAQARAHHDLGVVAGLRGRRRDALLNFFAAFQLYGDYDSKLRALSDVAEEMKRMGRYEAASRAFSFVLGSTDSLQVKSRALIALLEIAGIVRDPMAFGRYKAMIREAEPNLPPEQQVDFQLQLGIAYWRFGKWRKAKVAIGKAIALAENYGLNQYLFEAETIAEKLKSGPTPAALPEETAASAEPDDAKPGDEMLHEDETLHEIEEELMQLSKV